MNETPLTELDAINVILINMSEAPISSLEGSLPLDALKARGVLEEVSVAAQTRGWFWNREEVMLAPNGQGKIPVPPNTLEVKGLSGRGHVTARAGFLYRIEPRNNGDTFTDPVNVELTLKLPFAHMPTSARRYVALRAARIYQARELGDNVLMRNDSEEELAAWATLRAEDNANSRRNLKQSLSVSMVTERYAVITGN
nr:MAG TPA: tail tubular protein [Caudoviricetes sp.]